MIMSLEPSPLDFDTNDEKYNPLSGTPPYLISIVLPSSLLYLLYSIL